VPYSVPGIGADIATTPWAQVVLPETQPDSRPHEPSLTPGPDHDRASPTHRKTSVRTDPTHTRNLTPAKATALRQIRDRGGRTARGVDPGLPPRLHGAVVEVPLSLLDVAYCDLALVFWMKVCQLGSARHQPGCVAEMSTIAVWLGLKPKVKQLSDGRTTCDGPSSLYAAQKQLIDGGEMTSTRRTHRSGRGTSAVRSVRRLRRGERRVDVPIALAGAVPPRHFRAYVLIAAAHATGHQITMSELASGLLHQSGRNTGESISVTAARRVANDLERWGWVATQPRAGSRGRNLMIPRSTPFDASTAPVDNPASVATNTVVTPPHQRTSGAQHPGVSVATTEDTSFYLQARATSPGSSARRACDVAEGGVPVENPVRARPEPAKPAPSAEPQQTRHSTAPNHRITVSATAVRAFTSIGALVARMSTGQRLVAAGLVDRAVAEVGDEERVLARLADRWRTHEGTVRSPLGWLGGRGLPRRGCEDPNCEDGRLWLSTAGAGVDSDLFACRNCARRDQDRRAEADDRFGAARRTANRIRPSEAATLARPMTAPAPIGTCDDCDRAVRGLRADGLCADCRKDRELAF
jgi:hypothetical protein